MRKLSLLGLLLTFASSGCGTAVSLALDTSMPYGGTLGDGAIVVASVKNGAARISGETAERNFFDAPILAPFALIDLPFSIVADTLTLPYTIPAHRHRMAARQAEVEAGNAKEVMEPTIELPAGAMHDPLPMGEIPPK